ncbi:MAG TPA: nuclear transport factor 2 family protein [Chryseolinea sp.]|nr:nuclear transport factor 2 family protein [Chryseolinea sp.]
MGRTNPFDVVNNFNDAINSRDPGRLALFMSEDHTFVDSAGGRAMGRKDCIIVWERFFSQFPDYKNNFEHMELQGNVVITFGHSRCSDEKLNGPALWTATIKNNLIQEWRVYNDTPANRKLIGVPVL